MPLSWNKIKDRALAFSREWAKDSSEGAEAKSFWDGFFNVFGFFAGYQTPSVGQEDPVNAKAANLYGPLTMPPELIKAHQALDRAVDAAHGRKTFASEAEQVAFLFERYQALTSLLPEAKAKKRTRQL